MSEAWEPSGFPVRCNDGVIREAPAFVTAGPATGPVPLGFDRDRRCLVVVLEGARVYVSLDAGQVLAMAAAENDSLLYAGLGARLEDGVVWLDWLPDLVPLPDDFVVHDLTDDFDGGASPGDSPADKPCMRRFLAVVPLGASLAALLAAWPMQVGAASCGAPAVPAPAEPPSVVFASSTGAGGAYAASGCMSTSTERAPAAAAAFLATALTAAAVYQPTRRRTPHEPTVSFPAPSPAAVPRPREQAQA